MLHLVEKVWPGCTYRDQSVLSALNVNRTLQKEMEEKDALSLNSAHTIRSHKGYKCLECVWFLGSVRQN